jgi:hypothetical protein
LAHVNRTRICLGQRTTALWGSLVSRLWNDLDLAAQTRLIEVYGNPPDASPFADLVVSHELTHLADRPSHLDTQTDERSWGLTPRLLWFVELFANLGLHGYVLENEPDQQEVLEALFEVIGSTPARLWRWTGLTQMYDSLASADDDGANYCWYEFQLQMVAKRLWMTGGAAGFQSIHAALHGPVLSDSEAVDVIAQIDVAAAKHIRKWLLEPAP